MDFNVPRTFIEFKPGWNRGINFDQEVDLLLNELTNAEKNDIQRYIRIIRNGLS